MSNSRNILQERIGIIGAGVAGLITAHVLLKDGFTDITLITRDKSVGGTWARERVYPGLYINNVHGEYRFSALDMPPPENKDQDGGRLSGVDMRNYMEKFSEIFLEQNAKFEMETEVLEVTRNDDGIWQLRVEERNTRQLRVLVFSRVVLASGGCSNPKIPKELSQAAATQAGHLGMIIHSSQFAAKLDRILATIPETSDNPEDAILVIGGGKSAHDICAKLTQEGRKTAIVFEKSDIIIASPSPAPAFLRKSRLPCVLSPHSRLNTRVERFLHTTTIGSYLVHSFWKFTQDMSFKAFQVPEDSPLRRTHSLFWGVRASDEGVVRPNSFTSLAVAGKIEVISPARVVGYSSDEQSLRLSNGRLFKSRVVILATGYESSWTPIFTEKMAEEIGISRYRRADSDPQDTLAWKGHKSLNVQDVPLVNPENECWTTSIYRGLIPAKNIERRDFAIAGGLASGNVGYTNEVAAHWIASYFRCDPMRLPKSISEAISEGEMRSLWLKKRFPGVVTWATESEMTGLDFLTWPQVADELLEDMYLPSMRSGGNWFTWLFKVIDSSEIASLTEERRARRDGKKLASE